VTGDGYIVVHDDVFNQTWPDGPTVKDILIESAPDGWHLIINGLRPDANSVAVRMPVEFTPQGAIQISTAGAVNTITQTCTGDPCSACTLTLGVCKCAVAAHPTGPHCDSTIVITTPGEIFLKA
jgi:hypothetical protein